MSSTSSLHTRLKELSASLGQIHPLVDRLRTFTTAIGQGDEARLELGTEIHSLLKDAEGQMELLKVEVEVLESKTENRRKGVDSEKEEERGRILALAGRLEEDLKRYVLVTLLYDGFHELTGSGREAISETLNCKQRRTQRFRSGRREICSSLNPQRPNRERYPRKN